MDTSCFQFGAIINKAAIIILRNENIYNIWTYVFISFR